MTKEELIRNIRQYCLENANEENSKKYKRYFKEAPDTYGLSQPLMNEKAKLLLKEKSISLEKVVKAIPEILKNGKYEEISIGFLLLNGLEKQYSKELFNEIGKWFAIGIHNWAHADTLGMFILPKFFKHNVITIQHDFNSWLISPYKFQRRCVPVTLIKSLKSGADVNSLFDYTETLMSDPEREVHQGMGWFLRECWKLSPSETEAFLLKWKEKAPRLIIQYATEKMAKDHKLKFKRSK